MQFSEKPLYNNQIHALQNPLNHQSVLNKQNRNFNQSRYSHFSSISKPYVLPTARMNLGNQALLGASIPSGPNTFSDDYPDSTGWTEATNISVVSGKMKFNARAQDPVTSFKSLGFTLSDTLWYADFDFNPSAQGGSGGRRFAVFALCAGTGVPRTATQDAFMWTLGAASDYQHGWNAKDGGSEGSASNTTDVVFGLNYARLLRTSATGITTALFTDSGRTSHISGSPVAGTAQSTTILLTHLHHASAELNGDETLTATIDTTVVNDAVSP